MVNICITGHISIDKITNQQNKELSIGGPPCYAGIASKNSKTNVSIYTKIGYDFPKKYTKWLKTNNLTTINNISKKNTTKFEIIESNNNKELKLINKCENIELSELDNNKYDGILISPIVNEISKSNNNIINNFEQKTMLDPQGYLRKFNSKGTCKLINYDLNELPKTDIIKVSKEESKKITKIENFLESLKKISKHYSIVIGTNRNITTYLISKNKIYNIEYIKKRKSYDTIGLGDILDGVFFSNYLKGEEISWALSLGIACASSRNGTGIKKIEITSNYEEEAYKIYNNIKNIQ